MSQKMNGKEEGMQFVRKEIRLGDLLEITYADDYYLIVVRDQNQQLYWGYSHEIPEEYKSLIVEHVLLDWASECLGIRVATDEAFYDLESPE